MLLNDSYLTMYNFDILTELTTTPNISKGVVKDKLKDVLEKNSSKMIEKGKKNTSNLKATKARLQAYKINTNKIEKVLALAIFNSRKEIIDAAKNKDSGRLKNISKHIISTTVPQILLIAKGIRLTEIIVKLLFIFCLALFLNGFLHVYIIGGLALLGDLGDTIVAVVPSFAGDILSTAYDAGSNIVSKILNTVIYPIYSVLFAGLTDDISSTFNNVVDSIKTYLTSDQFKEILRKILEFIGVILPRDILYSIVGMFQSLMNPKELVTGIVKDAIADSVGMRGA